jgi:hypothetical protein
MEEQKQAQLQQEAWAVLLGSCAWQAAQTFMYDDVRSFYADAPSEVSAAIAQKLERLLHSGAMGKATQEQRRLATGYMERLEELEAYDEALFVAVEQLMLLHTAAAEQLAELRLDAFSELGIDTMAWLKQDEHAQIDAKKRSVDAEIRACTRKLRAHATGGLHDKLLLRRGLLDTLRRMKQEHDIDLLHLDSDDELEVDEMAREDSGQPTAGRAAAATSSGFAAAFAAADAGGSSGGGSREGDHAAGVYAGTSALRCVHSPNRMLAAGLNVAYWYLLLCGRVVVRYVLLA